MEYIVIVAGEWTREGTVGVVFTHLWNGKRWIGPGPGAKEFKSREDAQREMKKVPFKGDFVGIYTEAKETLHLLNG